jgi:hypothetical protein
MGLLTLASPNYIPRHTELRIQGSGNCQDFQKAVLKYRKYDVSEINYRGPIDGLLSIKAGLGALVVEDALPSDSGIQLIRHSKQGTSPIDVANKTPGEVIDLLVDEREKLHHDIVLSFKKNPNFVNRLLGKETSIDEVARIPVKKPATPQAN